MRVCGKCTKNLRKYTNISPEMTLPYKKSSPSLSAINGGQKRVESREDNLLESGCNGREMAQNSSESKENSTIESSINSQSQPNPPVAVTNALTGANQAGPTMKQDSNPTSDMISLESTPNPPEKQNGATIPRTDVIDLTRPVKTEGEPSSLTSAPMVDSNTSGNHSLSSRDGLASTPTSAESMGMATFSFGTQMAGLGAQLQLTAEEQAAAYKKANVLALTALAKKGGPNAKEMLAVQQKLQEFLTSLIALAGQKGPELKVKVQLLVQNLVVSESSPCT